MSHLKRIQQEHLRNKITVVVDQLNNLIIEAARDEMLVDLQVMNQSEINPHIFRLLRPEFFVIKD